jgi:ABC-2 type transport system ATP-binding protein
MTRESAIAAQELTRRFGEHLAVDQVSFDVVRGEVFGFLGPNGAGKTTTARMLTGFVSPSSGRALVWGYDLARQASLARRHIGVVPEEANVYAELTVWQNVMLMAELHGLARGQRTAQAHALLERFGLADRARQNGRELSKGLRQRLMLCMALVSGPDLLFLDEPTSGLDVASTHLIRDIITETNHGDGTTVFLTTAAVLGLRTVPLASFRTRPLRAMSRVAPFISPRRPGGQKNKNSPIFLENSHRNQVRG